MKIQSLYSRPEDDPKHRKNPDAVRPAPSPLGLAALSVGGGGSSGTSITINSTNGTVPYRTSATTFADSPLTVNAPAGTGISITSAAAGSGVTIGVTSSGANESWKFSAKGNGVFDFGAGAWTYAIPASGAGSIVLNNGSSDTPNLKFINANNSNYGIDVQGGNFRFAKDFDESGGQQIGAWNTTRLGLSGSHQLVFAASSTDASVTGVTGIGPLSAGILRITNGSTGAGQLLVGTSTDTADAQFNCYSQSTTRPGLKIRALSGTAAGQNVIESTNASGTNTFIVTADGTLTSTATSLNLTGTNAYVIAADNGGFQVSGRTKLTTTTDGIWRMINNAGTDFNRLQFGGASSSFPALKRSSTTLAVRLADDTDDAPLTTLTVKTKALTVATLPAAATVGAGTRAFVTDANTTHILGLGLAVVGGGANNVPVYSDGTNWIIG